MAAGQPGAGAPMRFELESEAPPTDPLEHRSPANAVRTGPGLLRNLVVIRLRLAAGSRTG